MIEPQRAATGITLTFGSLEAPLTVYADRTRVKQVLINLLSNAVKYNLPMGTVAVTCEVLPEDRVRVCIQDSGEGLSAQKVGQLFQPFNRLGQENGGKEGTGIGLVVSKRLVEFMGGAIGVTSEVGQGSRFWIDLDLVPAAMQGLPAPEPRPQAAEVRRRGEGVYTVLYVEDNLANLQLVEQILARRPEMTLLSARDGPRGIALARTLQPDVILLDINLPGMNGFQVMAQLGRDPLTASIPVLAISANAMPHDLKRGMDAGFLGYLTKPINVEEFMDSLERALEGSSPGTGVLARPGAVA